MFKLVQTCGACPEQYDVFLGDKEVGYLRLRHGYFRAEHKGELVYEANTKGDGLFTEDERSVHLNAACAAIKNAMDREALQRSRSNLYEIVQEE